MARRFLTRAEARNFYNRFGSKQDRQQWYENPATRDLLEHAGFETAMAVCELGCGTGAFAEEVLAHYLANMACYCGVDISTTMVDLTRQRLARFESRAEVLLTDGSLKFAWPDASVDRFVTNYVLDLLSPDDIRQALVEAYRLLRPEGRLCVVSLTCGRTGVARLVTWLWDAVHWLHPRLVGGCRPLQLRAYLDAEHWRTDYNHVVTACGVPSEITVASKRVDRRQTFAQNFR
jgi:ubiquinone/menaquinone biosynthesis C-methylase UbiE